MRACGLLAKSHSRASNTPKRVLKPTRWTIASYARAAGGPAWLTAAPGWRFHVAQIPGEVLGRVPGRILATGRRIFDPAPGEFARRGVAGGDGQCRIGQRHAF